MNKNNEAFSDDDKDEYIALIDDSGNEIHFEVIDKFNFNNNDYIVLLPFDDSDDEVIILEADYSQEEPQYFNIDSDEVLNSVFEEFLKRNN